MKRYIVEGRHSPKKEFENRGEYPTEQEARDALNKLCDIYTQDRVPFQGRVLEVKP